MDKVRSFIEKHMLSADSVSAEDILSFFMSEMKGGLAGKTSLEMIPTYVSTDSDIKPGDSVIVLDAGGTNFRTCLVTFDEDKNPILTDFKKVGMPGVKKEVSADEFFGILADNVERLIDKSDNIGFCFSYAATISEDHDGRTINFSKEIKAPEVVGLPVGRTLLDTLAKRGYDVSKKKICVINDTVATLLAAKAACPDEASGYVGFILGTGTNTAYEELNKNIKKIDSKDKEKSQIINVESGCLKIKLGDLDDVYMNTTKDPSSYHLEKKISGAYLGGFASLVIEKAIEEGVLSSEFAARFNEIEKINTTRMSHYLEEPHNKEYDLVACVGDNEEDATSLYIIIKSIIERAAKLNAINLTAAVLASDIGKEPRYPAVINADGTTFYKTEFLEYYTRYYLEELLSKKYNRYYKIINVDNSPTIGAAIAGLSI